MLSPGIPLPLPTPSELREYPGHPPSFPTPILCQWRYSGITCQDSLEPDKPHLMSSGRRVQPEPERSYSHGGEYVNAVVASDGVGVDVGADAADADAGSVGAVVADDGYGVVGDAAAGGAAGCVAGVAGMAQHLL